MRYVVLKDEKDSFTYRLETICQYDENDGTIFVHTTMRYLQRGGHLEE